MKAYPIAILLFFVMSIAPDMISAQIHDSMFMQTDTTLRDKAQNRLSAMRSRNHMQFPAISYNVYDGLQLGGVFSNYLSNQSGFKYTVVPLYAFASKRVVGSGSFSYNILKDSDAKYKRLRFGLEVRSYSYDKDETYGTYDQFYKVAPEIAFFRDVDKEESTVQHRLSYRFINIWQKYTRGIDFMTLEFERLNRSYYVNEIRYEQLNKHDFNPSESILLLHQGQSFVKLFGYRQQSFEYHKKRKISLRMSFTYLPKHDSGVDGADAKATLSGRHGLSIFQPDYTFDQNLIGRNKLNGIWAQQGFKKGAGLNTVAFGGSPNNWVVGFGIDADLPFPLKLNLYFDAGLYKPASSAVSASDLTLTYSGGLAIPLLGDYFQIYVPILESSDIKSYHEFREHNFWEKITFSLRLKNLDRLVDKFYN